MDFRKNLQNFSPEWVEMPFETFIQVGQRSRSGWLDKISLDNVLVTNKQLIQEIFGFQTCWKLITSKKYQPMSTCAKCTGWHGSILFADALSPLFMRYGSQTIYFLFVWAGEVVETQSHIYIEEMPIITPNGDIIVQSLSLKVRY